MELEWLPMELPPMELPIMEWLTMELTTCQQDMEQAMELPSPLWEVDLGNCKLMQNICQNVQGIL